MKSISEELGFKFHDLLPSLQGIPFNELQIIQGDSHPNELGHFKISQFLIQKLKRLLNNI